MIQIYICTLHIPFHYGLSQNIEYSSLCYMLETYCLSVLYILVSANPELLIHPSPTPLPLGNHKSILCL